MFINALEEGSHPPLFDIHVGIHIICPLSPLEYFPREQLTYFRQDSPTFSQNKLINLIIYFKSNFQLTPLTTMKTSTVSASLAALCTASADASNLVHVRTLSTSKSLPASLSARRDDDRKAFLNIKPTLRRLELSISMSLSLSTPSWERDSHGEDTHTAAATAQVESIEVISG